MRIGKRLFSGTQELSGSSSICTFNVSLVEGVKALNELLVVQHWDVFYLKHEIILSESHFRKESEWQNFTSPPRLFSFSKHVIWFGPVGPEGARTLLKRQNEQNANIKIPCWQPTPTSPRFALFEFEIIGCSSKGGGEDLVFERL